MESKYALNKKIFCVIQYNIDTWPTNTFQFYCTPIDHRPSVRDVWAKLDQSNEDMLKTRIFHINLLWPSHLTLKLCSRSLPLHKSSGNVKYELNWEYINDLDLQTSFQVTAHHFTIGTLEWGMRLIGPKIYALDKNFSYNSYNSVMTSSTELTWFKFTVHPSQEHCGWSMCQIRPRGERICYRGTLTQLKCNEIKN